VFPQGRFALDIAPAGRQNGAMRITIIAIGRLKAGPERDLAARYFDRLSKTGGGVGLELGRIVEIAESRGQTADARKREEAEMIRRALPADARLILLDERGETPSSEKFADALADLRDRGARDLVIAIGGADGHDAGLRAEAAAVVSFGRLTWPHQIVRILLAEQLYRAVTILSGHPYHRA
jgi:23S rRNA (pseudouridine1915-N3)-methyltransferase